MRKMAMIAMAVMMAAEYKVAKNILSLSKLKGASGFPIGKFKKEA
jgi:hypothetical protein